MTFALLAVFVMALFSIYGVEATTEINLNDGFDLLYKSQEEKAEELLPYLFFFLVLLISIAVLHEKWKTQN